MKKIILVITFLSIGIAFAQKNDQIFPKFGQINLTAANNGGGVGVEYSNRYFSVKGSSLTLREGSEEATNTQVTIGASVVDQMRFHYSCLYYFQLGLAKREMKNTLWNNDLSIHLDTMNKVSTSLVLGAGFRTRDLAEKPYMFFREFGMEGSLSEVDTSTSVSFINTFLFYGPKIGKKGLELNPFIIAGMDNKEIHRFQYGLFYTVGLKLRLYDYKKYYVTDILTLEYTGGGQADREVSSARITINVLGVIDFFSRKSPKQIKEECRCKKQQQYSYTAKTFPIPMTIGSEEVNNPPEKMADASFKKFTDFEKTDDNR